MPATKVQLTGGQFQDSEGNKLALGYLLMKLNQDANITGVGNIASGIEVKISLDSNGSVITSPAQTVWGNDQMLPVNAYYRVTGYTEAGQPAWGPNNQQVNGSGGTFDVGTWIPNQVISWTPPIQTPILETNEVVNAVQTLLDLHAGANVALTDNGSGRVTIAATGIVTPITVETNGIVNGSQTVLNLKNGTNVTIVDDGFGGVTINGPTIPTPPDPTPVFNNVHGVTALPASGGFTNLGVTSAQNGVATNVNATSTEPNYVALTTSVSTSAGRSGIGITGSGSSNYAITLGCLKQWQGRIQLPSTADIRVWFTLTSLGSPLSDATLQADNPNANMVGFRYSTVAGDTKWQCYTATSNSLFTSTPESTASHVDTNGHTFKIVWDGVNVIFYIDGTQVGSQNSTLSNTSQGYQFNLHADNVGIANAKSVYLSYAFYQLLS